MECPPPITSDTVGFDIDATISAIARLNVSAHRVQYKQHTVGAVVLLYCGKLRDYVLVSCCFLIVAEQVVSLHLTDYAHTVYRLARVLRKHRAAVAHRAVVGSAVRRLAAVVRAAVAPHAVKIFFVRRRRALFLFVSFVHCENTSPCPCRRSPFIGISIYIKCGIMSFKSRKNDLQNHKNVI